jgi:hypothetical protein
MMDQFCNDPREASVRIIRLVREIRFVIRF